MAEKNKHSDRTGKAAHLSSANVRTANRTALPKRKSTGFMVQALILACAALITRVLGFLYKLPIINMIDDEGLGLYGQGNVVYGFFFILSSAGLPAAISKMVSARIALNQRENAHKVFKVSLTFAFVIGLLSSLTLFFGASFFAAFINSPDVYYSLLALSPTVMITSILSAYRGYFQGMGNTVPTALSQIVEQIFNAIFSILLVYIFFKQGNIILAAAGGNAGTGIGAFTGLLIIILIYAMARGRIKRGILADKSSNSIYVIESRKSILKELVITAFPIIAGTAIFSFTSIIDTSMVMDGIQSGGYTHAEALSFYGLLSNKFNALTTLPVAIASAMATAVIPNISASVALNDKASVSEKVNLALRLAMIICVPAAFGMGVFAEQIYSFLFRSSPDGAYLLSYGFAVIIFLSLYSITTGVLQGTSQVKIPVISALLGCLVKVPVNYFLLPLRQINILGAVISTIVCYLVAAPVNIFFAYRFTGAKMDFSGIILKPIFSSAIMAVICYVTYYSIFYIYPSNMAALLVSIGVGILCYAFIMIVTGGLTKRELNAIPMGNYVLKAVVWLYGSSK